MLAQIAFVLISAIAIYLFSKKVNTIKRVISLGKDEDLTDQPTLRWKNVVLLALGQKKMFKNWPVAFMHLIVYAGFVIINIEVLEIVIDGIVGTHRVFASVLGFIYPLLINAFEVLATLVIIACIVFLVRRNVLKIKRFMSADLNNWPRSDANYILITEIVLMSLFLFMNSADTLLQLRNHPHYLQHTTGNFVISGLLQPLLQGNSDSALVIIERSCWWLHIAGIFAFLNYLPYSKHLHIILAFPNAYFARLTPQGQMSNMQNVQNEVLYAMQPELAPTEATATVEKFGAKDITDLSWKNILDSYSCTECGRCTAECPANITGKKLSPRAIMMKTRDRAEEVGKLLQKGQEPGTDDKTLLHDYITTEELRACTTCNACVEACPVSISPLDIIVQLRRYLIMEESNAPQEWNGTFSNIENNFAPWKFSPDERDKWAEEMA